MWRARLIAKSRIARDKRLKIVVAYFDEADPSTYLAGARFNFPLGTTRLEIIQEIRQRGIFLKERYDKKQARLVARQARIEAQLERTNTADSLLDIGAEVTVPS